MNYKKLVEKKYGWDGSDDTWTELDLTTYFWSEADIEDRISENSAPNSSFTLYPNPVSNILNIKTENLDITPNVKIYSIQGALILHVKGNQIDVSRLPNGIYIAEINGVCKKVVKQ
jgi:hypothetical protein